MSHTMDAAPVPLMPPKVGAMDKAGGLPETKLPFDPAHLAKAPESSAAPEPPRSDAPSQPSKEEERQTLHVPKPKPVEVKSVPDTPVNSGTPAGGTPRPELSIAQEAIKKPEPETAKATEPTKPEAAVLNGAKSSAESAGAPISNTPAKKAAATASSPLGAAAAGAAGQKRKLEDEEETEGSAAAKNGEVKPAEKKPRVDEPEAETAKPALNGVAKDVVEPAPAASSAPKKVGRPKKQKTAVPAVGRTQRQTRSQGPAIGGTL